MARLLIVARGLPSVVYASVELARRLAAAGHRVSFAGAPEARALVEHQGIDFLPLAPCRYEDFLAEDDRASALARLASVKRRRERARDAMEPAGFARDVRALSPDLVLVNGEMHEHVFAAWSTGAPIALLNSFVSIWRLPGLPPPHTLVRPGFGWMGSRRGTSLLWRALRFRKWGRAAVQRLQHVGCDRVSILRELARGSGVDFRAETDASQWLRPFTYRRLPVLSLHALELELPHRPPERVHYVGPMVLQSRCDRPLSGADEAALGAILERRNRSQGERKLVYAAFGSVFTSDVALLRRLVEAVAMRPHWDLVVSLSDRVPPQELGELPDGSRAFAWVPQLRVLRHADAVVTHGGIGTVDECVLEGVPLLVYCGFETDMAGTTARVVHHGLGIAGDRERDGVREILGHLDRLLGDPRYRDNVQRLRARFAAYAEDRVAERTVEALLRSRRA